MTKISDWDGCNDIFPECDAIYKLNMQFFENPFHGLTPTVPIVSLGTGKRKVELKVPSAFLITNGSSSNSSSNSNSSAFTVKNELKADTIQGEKNDKEKTQREKTTQMETEEDSVFSDEKKDNPPTKRKRKRYDDSDSESEVSDSDSDSD